jgi:hypothetical protein
MICNEAIFYITEQKQQICIAHYSNYLHKCISLQQQEVEPGREIGKIDLLFSCLKS